MFRAAGRVLPSTREYSERPSAVTSGATAVPISADGRTSDCRRHECAGRARAEALSTHLQRALSEGYSQYSQGSSQYS